MTWVLTVHNGGGSMLEASEPEWACTIANEAVAKQVHKALSDALTGHAYSDEDYWVNLIEVHEAKDYAIPVASAQQIAQAGVTVPPGQTAYDFGKLVEMLLEGEEIPLKPPPVTPEEEAEAIRLIMGGSGA